MELRDRELWIKAKWLYANRARGGEEWMRYVPTDEKLGLLLDEFTTKEANRIFPSNATHNGVKVFEKLSLVIPLELANPWVGIGGDDSEPLYNCIVVKTSGLVTIRRRDIQMDIPVVAKSISSQVVGMSGGVVRIAGPGAVEALARFRGGGPLRRLARGPAAYVQ